MKTHSILFVLIILFCLACEKEEAEVEEDDYLFSLTIDNDFTEDEIEESLKGIKRIGELKITKNVTDLNFLSEVTNIGELWISGNTQLTSLDPIYDININKNLILSCKGLDTLEQFNQINELTLFYLLLGDQVKVVRQDNLTKIRGDLRIRGPQLQEVNFPNLETVEVDLRIENSDHLVSFNFPKLKEAYRLYITENSLLSSLGDWPQLKNVKDMIITSNDNLSDVSMIDDIAIENIIQIKYCDIEDFCFLKEKILGDPDLLFFLRSSDNHKWELSDFEQCP
jgi:hypothetical protein